MFDDGGGSASVLAAGVVVAARRRLCRSSIAVDYTSKKSILPPLVYFCA